MGGGMSIGQRLKRGAFDWWRMLPAILIVLPLMLVHQLQLFVCAVIAQREGQSLIAKGVAS